MKYHAFMITCYKQPKLVARIISRLETSNHFFFVHVDKKTDISPFVKETEKMKNVFFTEQIKVNHARISQLKSEILLLHSVREYEIKYGINFDFIHLISGNDYPLRSNDQFDDFFDNTDSSFMLYDSSKYWKEYLRYEEHTVNDWHLNKGGLLSSIYIKCVGRFLGYVFPRKRIRNLSGGWDWWSWNSKTFKYVLDFLDANPGYIKRWNHTLCVTEKFFHTILFDKIDELHLETWNPLRFVSWKPRRNLGPDYDPRRPYDLTENDFDLVINSKAFFCRKVDEVKSAKLMDMIDQQRGNIYDLNDHYYFS